MLPMLLRGREWLCVALEVDMIRRKGGECRHDRIAWLTQRELGFGVLTARRQKLADEITEQCRPKARTLPPTMNSEV
jgi:hypothetical protein